MKNNKEEAMDYLSRFAQLIRGVLVSSTRSKITLHNEIKLLDHYLALEQIRHDWAFKYNIGFDSNVDELKTMIPPMLIQPFVENAVYPWFGRTRKKVV